MKSNDLNELFLALSKAQAEIKGAVKDSNNPFHKSHYADLSSVSEACRAPLNKNGLSVIQITEVDDEGRTFLVTVLAHSSGQFISGRYPLKPQKEDPQSLGAAMTYARRYSLAAIVGVTSIEDDDGESAMDRSDEAAKAERRDGPRLAPTDGAPICGSCKTAFMSSKINPNQWYCVGCKATRVKG